MSATAPIMRGNARRAVLEMPARHRPSPSTGRKERPPGQCHISWDMTCISPALLQGLQKGVRDLVTCRHAETACPCLCSKLRTDAKVRDVYKLGRTLGTGGEIPTASKLHEHAEFGRRAAIRHKSRSVLKDAHTPAYSYAYRCKLRGGIHAQGVQCRELADCFKHCCKHLHRAHAGFSVVKLAEEKATGAVFACKIMALPPLGSRTADGESTREDIFKEIEILVGLNNVNVTYLKEYFQENEKVHRSRISHVNLLVCVPP